MAKTARKGSALDRLRKNLKPKKKFKKVAKKTPVYDADQEAATGGGPRKRGGKIRDKGGREDS